MKKKLLRRIVLCATVPVLATMLVLQPAAATAPAQAGTTIQVSTETDEMVVNGACSLREAITAANSDTAVDTCPAGSGADIIELPAGVYALAIAGQADDDNLSGDLDVLSPLAIVGAGSDSTIIDGSLLDRVFHVDATAETVSISAVAIQNGRTGDADNLPGGGGVLNYATLTLTDVVVENNGSGGYNSYQGGGILNYGALTLLRVSILDNWAEIDGIGGGLLNRGQVEMTDSLVSGNHTWDAAAIFNPVGATATITNTRVENNSGANWGCGIVSNGSLILEDSFISQNDCPQGSGLMINAGSATVRNVQIANNSAELGGGLLVQGGEVTVTGSAFYLNQGNGVTIMDGDLSIQNSTISGNQFVGNGAGLAAGGGTTQLVNVTLTENGIRPDGFVDSDGGGIAVTGGYVTVRNTIVAGNHDLTPDIVVPDVSIISGTLLSEGYNLIGVGNPQFDEAEGDQVGSMEAPLQAGLSPLADHGGLTPTHDLLPQSPAVDAGDPLNCPPVDQRGYPRPVDGNLDSLAVCDVGAVETSLSSSEAAEPILLYLPVLAN
jgi:CSLREA domain-containing protein